MRTTNVEPASVAMIGTYPPTRCGLATFGAALASALAAADGRRVEIVEVTERRHPCPAEVVHQVVHGDRRSRAEARRWLAKHDAVIVQHEFGIFGGRDGREVLDLVRGAEHPVIVVLHTVLSRPTTHQRTVVEQLVSLASAVVVMTDSARIRLEQVYRIDRGKVRVIPHGAHPNPAQSTDRPAPQPTILSWGLLGPGKGLEAGIDALAALRDLVPAPHYLIVGETHPTVRAADGEAYRQSLIERATIAGVGHLVDFDNHYHDVAALEAIIRSADVVVVPYESREQVTSGVLIEAVASGRPVVATDFPHARELLASGAGLVVPHGSTPALAAALRRVLTDHRLAARMSAEAVRISAPMMWSAVGRAYGCLVDELVAGWTTPPAER